MFKKIISINTCHIERSQNDEQKQQQQQYQQKQQYQ